MWIKANPPFEVRRERTQPLTVTDFPHLDVVRKDSFDGNRFSHDD